MRILIAPDKFKGSLGAVEVGTHIAEGLRAALPQAAIEIVPVAEGGEGTADVICRTREGERMECQAQGCARAQPPRTLRLVVGDGTGRAGDEPWPVGNSSRLTSAIPWGPRHWRRRAFAARGAKQILLGLDGSVTNDDGSGLARALGFRFLDPQGGEIAAAGELKKSAESKLLTNFLASDRCHVRRAKPVARSTWGNASLWAT